MTSLVFFYLACVVILSGGLTVVLSRNIIYAAFGLMAALAGVAGLFILGSHYGKIRPNDMSGAPVGRQSP